MTHQLSTVSDTSISKQSIRERIADVVVAAAIAAGVDPSAVGSVESIALEHPAVKTHGDFATSAALSLAKKTGQNPRELATKIVQHIHLDHVDFLERIEVAGPGFLNFFLSKKYFGENVLSICALGNEYGKNTIGQGKTAIVEFSSPNIAKPFTIGHLRSTIIGDAVANILAFSGYSVLRDNHLGDWGTQFGKLIVAIKAWGNEDELNKSEQPVKDLVQLYVRFHTEAEQKPELDDEARLWFSKLEKGDLEARRLWKKCIDWSLVQFKNIYQILHVSFDMMLGESFFEDKMDVVLDDLRKANLLTESQGAQLVFFKDDVLPPLMILKKDGSTLYATRDLATDRYRFNTWGKDILVVNEVGGEQRMYFRQIYEIENMLGYCKKEQRVHVGHGLIRFKDGKMSTRKGNTIWLEDVILEAIKRASAFNPDVAETVGIGALKYNDLKRECSKDIVFDWDEALSLHGNSGPYIQYTFARTASVLEKAAQKPELKPVLDEIHTLHTKEDKVLAVSDCLKELLGGDCSHVEGSDVERLLYQFPEVVERAAKEYAPHHLCTYLFELAQSYNTYYATNSILDAQKQTPFRLALTVAVGTVIQNGLSLLGIESPKSM